MEKEMMIGIKPKLIVITGPSKTASIELIGEHLTIGRDPSNDLSLNDVSVSRKHCVITREGELFRIEDLESHNGTFINGMPVKEYSLNHEDQIRIGNSIFLLILRDADKISAARQNVKLDDLTLMTNSAVRLRIEDVLYSVARDLSALMKISLKINTIRSLDELQHQLLESLFEIIPAERGAILLYTQGQEEPDIAWGMERTGMSGQALRVSRTVTKQVMREGLALLSNGVIKDETLGEAQSLISLQVCSLICVPLVSNVRRFGLIYLDTKDTTVSFTEDHLRLATALANIAAVSFENVRYLEKIEAEKQSLLNSIQIEHKMIGESQPMKEIYQKIGKIAQRDSTTLILGESGTGKELAARAIHQNSERASMPFVALNCATLTDTLLESELFGHEKGAFTGAIAQKKGKLELAEGGTLFLDEIGELVPPIQAKLLRVLQEREFERVGGIRPIKIDVRLIAATNRILEETIKQGGFRADLYYRLNVVSLKMPALRERREDIQLLASYFAAKYSDKCKRAVNGITTEARACLADYDWPGNVRELENAIERAIVLGSTDFICVEDLPETILETTEKHGVPLVKYYEAINEAKKELILKAVEQSGGNYTEAAKVLGIHPNNLHRLIRNMNLRTKLKG
jgi:transcriptional regulator with GAF, ATPase, and Fis domain